MFKDYKRIYYFRSDLFMKYQIVNGYNNSAVVSFYLDIIYDALSEDYEDVEYIQNFLDTKKNANIVVSHTIEAFHLFVKGYKNIILWQQGIGPEESFMRNRSRFRRFVFYMMEKIVFKKAKKIIFVSKAMQEIYEKKFHLNLQNYSFIMPCFSASIKEDAFTQSKYDKNTFAYVGSIAKWQCFDETLGLFVKIKEILNDATLEIYTFQVDQAREIADRYGLRDVRIEKLSNDELLIRMENIKFGFLLREDNIVNNVATPTKLSTYLSTGVIPITMPYISDFKEVGKEMKYVIWLNDNKDTTPIISMCEKKINARYVKKEYNTIFDDYYNRDKYVEKLALFFRS